MLETHHLVKKYGDFTAVNDVSFEIAEGEVFGLLGPNGAGKSTMIAMISGLFPPTEGEARVGGHDVVKELRKVKTLIGVVPQDLALYPTLSGYENIAFFGQLFGLRGKELRERASEVLGYVGMQERAKDPVKTYSGGMKRRINLAVGLINRPRLLFLDEPTVGVDPQSRNHIFESVERLNREQGMAILYTTHYMEEAERLCHRVGIIDRGRLIALDTPRNLVAQLGGGIIQMGVAVEDEALCAGVQALPAVSTASFVAPPSAEGVEMNGGTGASPNRALLKIEAVHGNDALLQVLHYVNEHDIDVLSLDLLEPNLETVFLHLTGKNLRD
ncbi:MAG: ATP-binding cassette domain-containing protein [Caldilineaceae bacterium]|nr:ATP-binding cassette domain-containing protein [Caldilineaceae bacterium]